MPNPLWGGLAVGVLIAAWRWGARPAEKRPAIETLARRLGSAARAAENSWERRAKSLVDLADARRLLGVGESATSAEIESAYRRLMLRAHPDHGGTDGLAAQLTAARDRLIKKS